MAALVLKNTIRDNVSTLKSAGEQTKNELEAIKAMLLETCLKKGESTTAFEKKLKGELYKIITKISV